MVIERFGVYLVALDPTLGAEIKKTRPCTVISPDESNLSLRTVIVAPLTTAVRRYPSRVDCKFGGKNGQVAIDQIRAVDKARLVKRLGMLDTATSKRIVAVLLEMFS
jgi:mRNA interferase MazF